MLHTNNPIIKHKAGLLNLAEELGNVSKACKIMSVSRDTFYRYQELVEHGGIDALIDEQILEIKAAAGSTAKKFGGKKGKRTRVLNDNEIRIL